HDEQQAAGGADGERFEHREGFGAAGQVEGDCGGDLLHTALWQICKAPTNALMRCSNAGRLALFLRKKNATGIIPVARGRVQSRKARETAFTISACRSRPSWRP